tara:strand:- start:863 stop:1981 length:1119 start_codon:yes stop_codon:yes gene_type:complete
MMQTGGLTSTAGGTALARALQMQLDRKKLERQQRAEAKRQKRGGLFGSIGSLAGGILGSIIPGVGTAIGAGLGAGLGRRIGEGLGAGKTKKYDTSGTVFGQQAFRDVQQASRDYTRGMGERALLSGAQTALKTYLSPGGGFFEKAGRDLQSGLGISTGIAPTVSPVADTSLMDSLLKDSFSPSFSPRFSLSTSSYDPRSISFAGGSPLIGYTQPIVENFQDGGYTAERILQESGFEPTEEQLGLFQQFDPGEIERAKERTEQSLLSMTGGMGLSSLGGGFGARQRAATSAIGRGEDLIGDVAEQSQRDFESQTLGTMADLIAGGAEFVETDSNRSNYQRVEQMPMVNLGHGINYNGQDYVWSEEEGQYIREY